MKNFVYLAQFGEFLIIFNELVDKSTNGAYTWLVDKSTNGGKMQERFETFTVIVSKISRNIRRIKTEEMAEFDLKSPHVSCLYYLYKVDSLTAKELCDICDEDKSAISRSIEHLESTGYISCESTAKKRYKSQLTLTDKGREVGFIITQKIDKILELASEGLSEEDRVILYRSLGLVSKNLQKICDNYGEN